jgi:hypothetical protein
MRATCYLLLTAQFLILGHLLVVRHSFCSEHGEAVHPGPPGLALATHLGCDGAATNPMVAGEAPSAEQGHEHCLAMATTRERFAVWPATDLATEPVYLVASFPLWSKVDQAVAVAVLRLAPKNSPPLA